MVINISYGFLHLIFWVLLYFLLCLTIANATSGDHQLVGEEAGGGYNCIDKERNALLHFKAYILHDPYEYLSTWTLEEEDATTMDCCKWRGVMCDDQTGRVTSLELTNGKLRGEVSPSLFNLTYLNRLDLWGNSFNGTIPIFFGSMTRITYLDLGSNYFSGTIPVSIGSMSQLRYLGLGENYLTGTIPPILGNLTNLEELSLKNLINCTLENLDWLSRLSHLERLDMSGISLAKENHWVNVITGLHNLSQLTLAECDLSQVVHPWSLSDNSSSSAVASLFLKNNNLNSSMYQWLLPLTSNRLEVLDLSGNKLDGIPKFLGNLCNLTSLDFHNNSVSIKLPNFLNNLSGWTSVALQRLDASSSQFTGSVSDDIQEFSSLQVLDLSHNLLNGTISENLWHLPNLDLLKLSFNYLKGALSENIGKISYVYLSNNSLEGVRFEAHMSNSSNIKIIDLSSCNLGPAFPKWIQTLMNLTHIDIANAKISDTIPEEFWNAWPSQLTYLNLSSNNISGKVTNLLSNFGHDFSLLDLSSNNFHGSILNISSTLERLDLSKNKFYGGISFLCKISNGFFTFLDLSHNSFTGQLPDCLWKFKELKVLSLGHNNLYGMLPHSIQHLINLEVLYLYNNNFSGELPLSLQDCTNLTFLELGANTFSGYVPTWLGEKLSRLYALSLTSNSFSGTIPLQLCQLETLQILDLSMNNLYGTIPTCLNNLTAIVHDGVSSYQNMHTYFCLTSLCERKGVGIYLRKYVDRSLINWQGSAREFSSNLGLLKSIDLSSNNLVGEIPYEVTTLHGLIALNLSNNGITGKIPQNISEMKKLLTLDLSRNNLSGGLPLSMSQMSSLNYLNVSYNNLLGRIPSSTQLQSFEPSRYIGNLGLCGPPVSKYFLGDKEIEVPDLGQSENGGEMTDEVEKWLYIGGATGFATGFWIACGALLVNRHGRKAFFHFIDSLRDWICVKMMVFVAKWQQATHA